MCESWSNEQYVVLLLDAAVSTTETGQGEIHTCQEQAAVSGVHLDLCIQFAGCIFEPVALIDDDVLPGQLGQAGPVLLPHHEVIAGQQHIKAGLTPSNLHQIASMHDHRLQNGAETDPCFTEWLWPYRIGLVYKQKNVILRCSASHEGANFCRLCT